MKSSITKRIMAGIVCAMVAVSICGCSEKPAQSSSLESSVTSDAGSVSESVSEASDSTTATGTAAEITAKIKQDVKFPGMAEIGADRMAGYYDVAADKIDSYSAYICGSGAYPDGIEVFRMKSADDVNAVKSVLEKRVENQSATFKDYTPDEMYKIDGNNVVTSGNYVALIICADNAKAIEDFKAMAKKISKMKGEPYGYRVSCYNVYTWGYSVLICQSRQNPLGHSDRSAWDTAACKLRVLLCLYCVFGVRTA